MDLVKTCEVPSSSKIRTCTVAAEAALAAAAAAWAAAAAASLAFLDELALTTSGILGGNAVSTKANLSRHVSQAKSLPVPESTTDQSLALYTANEGISGHIIETYLQILEKEGSVAEQMLHYK